MDDRGWMGRGAAMKISEFVVMERAIEEGVRLGWRRAHKHVDDPDEAGACDVIESAVWLALDEAGVVFDGMVDDGTLSE